VTLSKTAEEAKSAWRDEERNQAMFGQNNDDRGYARNTTGDRDNLSSGTATGSSTAASGATSSTGFGNTGASSTSATDTSGATDKNLDRSFPGTY
jgi:hypothetical protein